MRLVYGMICEHAHVREDGRIDVHGVFHQLFAPGFPAQQDRLVLAMSVEWEAEGEGTQEFSIDLLDPSGSPALTVQGQTDVHEWRTGDPPPRTLLILPMEDVVFPLPGTYFFQLGGAGQTVRFAPLHLIEDATLEGGGGSGVET